MGGNRDSHGPTLPQRSRVGGKEILALCTIGRSSAPCLRLRIEAIRIVDMSVSNSWAELAALFRNTRSAFLDHETSQMRAQGPDAGRRQGGDRPWGAGQALALGGGE